MICGEKNILKGKDSGQEVVQFDLWKEYKLSRNFSARIYKYVIYINVFLFSLSKI